MKIKVIGAGPAGLYFAIQIKKSNPDCDVQVLERNPKGSTFGWGVVFSDETLQGFLSADEPTAQQINQSLFHWDDIEVHFKGKKIRSSGHGFSGLGRQRLLDILDQRASELGISVQYEAEIDPEFSDEKADLIVAADGIFSKTRERYQEFFQPQIDWRKCKYVWFGSERLFDAFTFVFKETEHGWFQAHCYQFSPELSTFIVECHQDTWQRAGLDQMSKDESIAYCQDLFRETLQGHKLLSNARHLRGSSVWISFPRVDCKHWFHNNIVLLGDSSASAHFSIGSGTKLAMESATALAAVINERVIKNSEPLPVALASYQAERKLEVLKLQSAARNSTEWFENVDLKAKLEPEQFNYSLLTRSQRIGHQNLRLRDSRYLENYERWFEERETGRVGDRAKPPMFVPIELRGMKLSNRVAVSPMAMYSADEGLPGDFHLVHLGQRALGGAALVFTEMTCVSADARITPGCAGMYSDQQMLVWKRIVDFVHRYSESKIALQLGHAGRKGSTRVAWQGMDLPLEKDNWELFAPSAIAYSPKNQLPTEMNREHMRKVRNDFVAASKRAAQAGFDMLELHCAHGYLLSTFLSPLCNKRNDEYGGSLEKRLVYPLEIFSAMREVWPADKPMSVRISATDWVEQGTSVEDSVRIAHAFREAGLDVIDVSTGQVSIEQRPVYGRMFQTPFADRIRAETGMFTMAVGNIFEADHVNSIIASGRADICLLARPHLSDPHWTLRAAAEQGYQELDWPEQYESGKQQLYRLFERTKAESGAI